tara:strand:+ start:329 stop:511 length:183 start_codon:yes stop_codon:yes gene_type:complete
MAEKNKFGIFMPCDDGDCDGLARLTDKDGPLEFDTRKDAFQFFDNYFDADADVHILNVNE